MTVNTRATNGGAAHAIAKSAGNRLVLWNVGPGVVYWSRSEAVATSGPGIPIAADSGYEFPANAESTIYVTSDTDATDLRVERV